MAQSAGQAAKEVAQDAGGQVLGAVGMAKRSDTDKEPGLNKVQEEQEQGKGQDGSAKHSLNDQAHADAAQGLSGLLEGDSEGEHVVTRGQGQQAEEIARSAALEAIELLAQTGTSHQKLVARELQEDRLDPSAEGQDKARDNEETHEAGVERSQGTELASTQPPARSQHFPETEQEGAHSLPSSEECARNATQSEASGHGSAFDRVRQGEEREVSRCPDKGHVEALKSQLTGHRIAEGRDRPAQQERSGGDHVKGLQEELQEKVKGDYEQPGISDRVRAVLDEGRVGAVTEAIERQGIASAEENIQLQGSERKVEEHHSERVQALKAELQKQVEGVDKVVEPTARGVVGGPHLDALKAEIEKFAESRQQEGESRLRKEPNVKIEQGMVEAVKSNLQKVAEGEDEKVHQGLRADVEDGKVQALKSELHKQAEEESSRSPVQSAGARSDLGREKVGDLKSKLRDQVESAATEVPHTEKPVVGKLDREVIENLEEKLRELESPSTTGAQIEKPPVGKLDKGVIEDLEEKLGDLALPTQHDAPSTKNEATPVAAESRDQGVEGGLGKSTATEVQQGSLSSQNGVESGQQLASEGMQSSAGVGGDEKRQKVGDQEESPALTEALEGLKKTREEKDDLTKGLEEAKENGAAVADQPPADAPKKEGDVGELEKLGEENEKGQAKTEEAEKKLEAKAVNKDAPVKGTVKESNNKAAVQKGA